MAMESIASAPRDGSTVFVCDKSTIAKARWCGDMWAYALPDMTLKHQVDFEPTHWTLDSGDFLGSRP